MAKTAMKKNKSVQEEMFARKNLFAESHEAAPAERHALLPDGTCKLHGVNPFDWLKNVLELISTHPINKNPRVTPVSLEVHYQQ